MAVNAQTIIQGALEELGLYAPGEVMTDADAARGLSVLNQMMDEWSSQYLYVYQLSALTLNLTAAVAQYTISSSSLSSLTTSGQPPRKVQMGPGVGTTKITSTSATSAVNVVSPIEWQMIESVSPGTGVVDTMFYDPQYPTGKINVAPTPTTASTLAFNAWLILSSFPDLYTSYSFGVGVQKALQDNLAVLLKSYFSEAQLNQAVVISAAEAKDFIRYQSINSRALIKRTMLSTGRSHSPKPDMG